MRTKLIAWEYFLKIFDNSLLKHVVIILHILQADYTALNCLICKGSLLFGPEISDQFKVWALSEPFQDRKRLYDLLAFPSFPKAQNLPSMQ